MRVSVSAPVGGRRSSSQLVKTSEPFERVLLATDAIVAGEFRCPTSYPGFANAGRITLHVIGFPRTAVWIDRDDVPRFVADPGQATMYNPRQDYSRAPISPEGDRSDWLGVAEHIVRDIVGRVNPADAERERPLRFAAAVVSSDLYRAQAALYADIRDGTCDVLEAEERAIELLSAVLQSAYRVDSTQNRRGTRPGRELVDSAKEAIMTTLFENTSVTEIARHAGFSVFHLCRSFRAATGVTLHAYRREMRLRAALVLMPEFRGNLSGLAVRTGFYSHSHFTASFRRAFGCAPSGII